MPDFDLSRDVVDQVRDAADVIEVVGEHVKLKRRGRKFEGLCPFHQEKTPSFSVDPDRGLYYCFGCHRGGDLFKFVMEAERLSFPETVERLARRYGVRLPARSPEASQRQQEADRIRGLLEEAQRFFVEQLASADGSPARRELERRGFDKGTWGEFGFGWAPDDWRQLTEHLARRHPEGSLIAAGLTVEPDSGKSPYDRFRNRITFPIRSTDGRLVGFGGRIFGAGEPKYLNSPESPIFRKRSTLFCLDRARTPIRTSGEVVVVEGYFDCLSLHRAGIDNSVATLGTALTREHAQLLRRDLGVRDTGSGSEARVLLCYDADTAGRRAAMTGIRVLLEAGVGVAVIELPEGSDPDDVIREGGIQAAEDLFAQPTSLIDFLIRDLPETPTQRQRAAAGLAEVIAVASDPHTKNELLMELSLRLGFSTEVLRDLARRTRNQTPPGGRPPPRSPHSLPSGEAMLARIILEGGPTWQRRIARDVEVMLPSDPRVQRLVASLKTFQENGLFDKEEFHSWLLREVDDDELTTLLAHLSNAEVPELTDQTILTQMKVTLNEQWRNEARSLTAEIQRVEQEGDDAAVARLQTALSEVRLRRPNYT